MSDLTRLRDWARQMAETQKPLSTTPLRGSLPHPSIPREAMPTDQERILWRQIADEIDAFINRDEPTPDDNQLELTPAAPNDTTEATHA